jgi:hypothetical protein
MKPIEEGIQINGPTFKQEVKPKHMENVFFDIRFKPGTVNTKRPWRLPQSRAVENSLDCLVAALPSLIVSLCNSAHHICFSVTHGGGKSSPWTFKHNLSMGFALFPGRVSCLFYEKRA